MGWCEPGFGAFLLDYWQGGRGRRRFDGWEHGMTWNHLWYLAYLWIYTMALGLLIAAAALADLAGALRAWFTGCAAGCWCCCRAAVLAACACWLQPRFPRPALFHDWYRTRVLPCSCSATWSRASRVLGRGMRLRWATLSLALCLHRAGLRLVPPADLSPDEMPAPAARPVGADGTRWPCDLHVDDAAGDPRLGAGSSTALPLAA